MSLFTAILSCPGTRRGLIVSVLILLSTGCGDTSQSPEDPTILGVPPDTAYLGVDYSYNFGAAGGDQLLNYSLSNNPSWLALEKTTNRARSGIVLRGQPGISGGRNGEADLGLNESIRITTNDGSLLGNREFEIDVEHNALTIVGSPITEGRAFTPDVDKNDDAVCEIPDMSVTREVEVYHQNLVSGDDENFSSARRTYTTRPALLRVDLDQPSVEAVSVRFRVSENNPRAEVGPKDDTCKDNANEPCEYQDGNRTKAIFGEDLLLNGNSGKYESNKAFPEPPGYIEFIDETDEGGTGVLTFEPGKTSCFIPVWVHDDNLAESTEKFNLELQEVTEGLATIEGSGASADVDIEIEDETPTVSFRDERIVATRDLPPPNEGTEVRAVTAQLDRANDTGEVMRAGVEWLNDLDEVAANVEACYPTSDDADCTDTPPLVIEFGAGEQESEFYLRVNANDENGDPVEPDPLAEDERFQLGFSADFLFGREFAAFATDTTSKVTVNEWATDVVTDFDMNTLVAGLIGEVYAAGTDDSGNLQLRSINRLGETTFDSDRDVVNLSDGATWPAPTDALKLDFSSRDSNTDGAPETTRYLGLGYSSGQDAAMEGQLALFSSVISKDSDTGELSRSSGGDDLQWQYGTETDDLGVFALRGLSVSNEGDLSIGATGDGDDPIRLAQLDNNTGGDSPEPDLRWSQSETTHGANNVVGLVSAGLAGFTAIGSTEGTVEADDAVGLEDFFFLGVDTDGSISNRAQLGTDEKDTLSVVDGGSTRVWLGGQGDVGYELDDFSNIEPDSPLKEGNAFLMVTTSRGGSVQAVRNFAESETEPVPASVDALNASGNSAVIAGASKDAGVPYLSRFSFNASADDNEDRISLEWRTSIEGAEEVLELSFFDERKIFVGFRKANGDHVIRLYDLHGNQLTQP